MRIAGGLRLPLPDSDSCPALVRHRDMEAVELDAGFDEYCEIGRRILRGIFEQVRQRDRGDAGIDLDLGLLVGVNAQGMSAERLTHLRGGGVDDVGRRHPLRLEVNRGGVDAGHVLFLAFRWLEGAPQILDGDPNGRNRRLQVVAERGEKCRRQIGFLPDEVGGLPFAEKLRALDGNRHDAGDGVQCAQINGRRHGREQANGLGAVTQWHDERVSGRALDAGVATVGSLAGVELQRAARLSQRRVQRRRVNSKRRATCLASTSMAPTVSVVSSTSRVRSNSRVTSLRLATASAARAWAAAES